MSILSSEFANYIVAAYGLTFCIIAGMAWSTIRANRAAKRK
jgi:heme exporter protein CcmD